MYHKVPMPGEQCQTLFNILNDLIKHSLTFAAQTDLNDLASRYLLLTTPLPNYTHIRNNLHDALPSNDQQAAIYRIERAFADYAATLPPPYNTALLWLWDKRQAPYAAPLVRLIVVPRADKAQLVAMFEADRQLKERWDEGRLHYTDSLLSGDADKAFKQLMRNFYEKILSVGDGIPANVIGQTQEISRKTLLNEFTTTYRDSLHVCPACDESPPPMSYNGDMPPIRHDTNGFVLRSDLDHFFPLSRYPVLAVNPLNLVPFCKNCNEVFKHDTDPLTVYGVNGHLSHIYHPFFGAAQNAVSIELERKEGTLWLHVRPATSDPRDIARRDTLIALFAIEARWRARIAIFADDPTQKAFVGLRMESAIKKAKRYNQPFTRSDLHQELCDLRDEQTSRLGIEVDTALKLAYVDWLLADQHRQARLMRILGITTNVPDFGPDVRARVAQMLSLDT